MNEVKKQSDKKKEVNRAAAPKLKLCLLWTTTFSLRKWNLVFGIWYLEFGIWNLVFGF
jgi:hypothetical protein